MQKTRLITPKFYLISVFFMCVFLSAVFVHAEEKTKAEQLQEALMNGTQTPDVETETSVSPTPTIEEPDKTELEIAWENLTAGQIVTGIKQLDMEYPDTKKVSALRKSYEKLSDSDKVRVTNIDALAQAEARIIALTQSQAETQSVAQVNTNNSTRVDDVNSTEYTFISTPNQSLTLVLRYTTDDNSDGRGDRPEITIISPDSIETPLTTKMTEIKDSRTNIAFIWEQSFFQMDVAYAAEGSWTIKTDIPVTFMKSDYKGNQALLTAIKEETETPKATPTPIPQQSSYYAQYIKIGGVLFALIAAVVLFWFYSKGMFNGKKKDPDNSKEKDVKKENSKEEIDDEIERIKKELEEQKRLNQEADEQYENEIKGKEQNKEEDEDLYMQTMEPVDEDLEEYQEGDTGLLAKKEEEQKQPKKNRKSKRFGTNDWTD